MYRMFVARNLGNKEMFKVKLKRFTKDVIAIYLDSRFVLRMFLMYVHMTSGRLKINDPSTDRDQVLQVLHITK